MKLPLFIMPAILAFGLLATVSPVLAQTPDGQTPAGENVCDPLRDDSVTKGLYGLCVAFCEAQDYADELDSITEEELATLESSTSSGRILANYNKRKQDGDPDMPCILVEEPCPCWSAQELAEIDGVLWDGTDTDLLVCRDYPIADGWFNGSNFIYEQRNGGDWGYRLAHIIETQGGFGACKYESLSSPGDTLRYLSRSAGTLTEDEYTSCVTQLNDHKALYIGTKDCVN